jgi:hypothetical protein
MSGDSWFMVALGAVIAALIALMTYGAIAAHRERARCTDNGGTWVSVNCRQVEDQICSTTDYGNNMVITSCTPTTSTVCDTVCRGARAEAGGAR